MSSEPDTDYAKCKQECSDLREAIHEKRLQFDPQILAKQAESRVQQLSKLRFEAVRVCKGHYGKVYDLNWTRDSSQFCSASQDGNLLIWNPFTGTKKLGIRLQSSWVMTCAFSPSQNRVAVGGLDNLCSIYQVDDPGSLESAQPLRELQQHEGYLSSCRFVNDEEILTASGDSTCILWDIDAKTAKSVFYDHTGDVMTLSPHPDGNPNTFISGACDATAKIWDYRAGEACIGTFTGHDSDVNSVEWFPDGQALASGSDDSTCRLFDLRAYRQLNVYKEQSTVSGVTSVAFSTSGRLLLAGYDEDPYCQAWDSIFAQVVSKLDHTDRVSCLGTSPNGGAIATGSWDQLLRLWVLAAN